MNQRFLHLFTLALICYITGAHGYASVSFSGEVRKQGFARNTCLFQAKQETQNEEDNNAKSKNKKKGYQFGDITRAIGRKVTGKEDYKFGDLTKGAVEAGVRKIGNDDGYQFGDLSRWVDSQIKEQVNAYTNQEDYKFGDISKEIVRRVRSGEYTLEELLIMLKVLTSVTIGLAPGVAQWLPAKLLVELLNLSILQDVGDRVKSSLSMELDRRMKLAMTGNADYQFGDLTRSAVNRFTGQDQYNFGDITRTIMMNDDKKNNNTKLLGPSNHLSSELIAELEHLDNAAGIQETQEKQPRKDNSSKAA